MNTSDILSTIIAINKLYIDGYDFKNGAVRGKYISDIDFYTKELIINGHKIYSLFEEKIAIIKFFTIEHYSSPSSIRYFHAVGEPMEISTIVYDLHGEVYDTFYDNSITAFKDNKRTDFELNNDEDYFNYSLTNEFNGIEFDIIRQLFKDIKKCYFSTYFSCWKFYE